MALPSERTNYVRNGQALLDANVWVFARNDALQAAT